MKRKPEIFKECDGYYRAVITDRTGTRRNVARTNCKTKREAQEDVREYWLGVQEPIQREMEEM